MGRRPKSPPTGEVSQARCQVRSRARRTESDHRHGRWSNPSTPCCGEAPSLGVVLLTMGDRPHELSRALESVRRQAGPRCQIVLVLNGVTEPPFLRPPEVDVFIELPENVGVPAARNRGAQACESDLVLFLDDDAELLDDEVVIKAVERFDRDSMLSVITLRLVDETGSTARRHVPRIGGGSASTSGPVTSFLGGACVVRKAAFSGVGGYPPEFFYAMEETDLAWRLIDAGWTIWYAAEWRVFHPAASPSRHGRRIWFTARNRFLAAWRSLPAPFLVTYLLVWALISLLRGESLRAVVAGYRAGWRARPSRAPIRWPAVVRLARLGRPPVV